MKKIIFLFVMISIVSSLSLNVIRAESYDEKTALILESYGMFKGTDKGFELDREATRVEGLILMLRMLREEGAAKDCKKTSKFTDVPKWAQPIVAYAYDKGYTNGVSDTQFGADAKISGQQYITMLLRAMGYDDKNGDFTYNSAYNKAIEVGLMSDSDFKNYSQSFFRGDCAEVMLNALISKKKGSETSMLVEFGLVEKGQEPTSKTTDYVKILDPSKATYLGDVDHYIVDKASVLGESMMDATQIMSVFPNAKYTYDISAKNEKDIQKELLNALTNIIYGYNNYQELHYGYVYQKYSENPDYLYYTVIADENFNILGFLDMTKSVKSVYKLYKNDQMDFTGAINRIKELKKHYVDQPLVFCDIEDYTDASITKDQYGQSHLALKNLDFNIGRVSFVFKSYSIENYENDKNDVFDCLTYIGSEYGLSEFEAANPGDIGFPPFDDYQAVYITDEFGSGRLMLNVLNYLEN